MTVKPYGWLASIVILWNSSSLAANNPLEATEGSSSGGFDVELIVPPLAQIGFPASVENIDFGNFDESFGFQDQQQAFCIFHNTNMVTMVANSSRSADNGRFVLAHSSVPGTVSPEDVEGIEYQVEVLSDTLVSPLVAGIPTGEFTAENARTTDAANCLDASTNMNLRLKLSSAINFNEKNTGAYTDELTLTVLAE